MKIAVVGLGLIGGSFEKASLRAGHEVVALHHGDTTGFEEVDLILVCLPPDAIVPWIEANATHFRKGTIVVDIAGVKREILNAFDEAFPIRPTNWTFVGGHPMAGREVSGYTNAQATLFEGASMILVPPTGMSVDIQGVLKDYFHSVGFARIVVTTAAHHDEMIAFTSQLCHVIATAYARDGLVPETTGYSAGSYADMTRIATQDPAIWSELFCANHDSLLTVIDRFIGRMTDFRKALATKNKDAMAKIISEGADAKRRELCSARS